MAGAPPGRSMVWMPALGVWAAMPVALDTPSGAEAAPRRRRRAAASAARPPVEEDEEEGPDCAICLERVPPAARGVLLPCLHDAWHSACVSAWLDERLRCPLCAGRPTSVLSQFVGGRHRAERTLRPPPRPPVRAPAPPPAPPRTAPRVVFGAPARAGRRGDDALSLERRARLYEEQLWTVPHSGGAPQPPRALAQAAARAPPAALQAFVERELRAAGALAPGDDPTVLRALVVRLCVGGVDRAAEDALRPFLGERAAHFWHEVRCYLASPIAALEAYDAAAAAVRRGGGAAPSARGGGGDGAGSAARRRSWSLLPPLPPLWSWGLGGPAGDGDERRRSRSRSRSRSRWRKERRRRSPGRWRMWRPEDDTAGA